ncbi:hypothetical protein [Effusibacillus pohliae]|uniref:hypothetical protein n=1 Tax=Effusibacillus pohliae TaxID=232270 RepID=UPI0003605B73|nr:hypothetical protein [Effusibacillus pohliae]
MRKFSHFILVLGLLLLPYTSSTLAKSSDVDTNQEEVVEQYSVTTDPVEIEKKAKDMHGTAKIDGKEVPTKSLVQPIKKVKNKVTGQIKTEYREDIIAYVPKDPGKTVGTQSFSGWPSGANYTESKTDTSYSARVYLACKYSEYTYGGRYYVQVDWWWHMYDRLDSSVSITYPRFWAEAVGVSTSDVKSPIASDSDSPKSPA